MSNRLIMITMALGLCFLIYLFTSVGPPKEDTKPDPASAAAIPAPAPPRAPVPTAAERGLPEPVKGGPRPTPPAVSDAEVCADCHPDAVDGFLKTGMGRSLYRPVSGNKIEIFSPRKATVKDKKSGLYYRASVDKEGRYWQEEFLPSAAYSRKVEALYVVGSGNHTRSYLGEVDGELVQLPLTWYSRKRIWDLSPGYESNNFRFTRPVTPKCLFCHNDQTPYQIGTIAKYTEPLAEGISCTRCHGDPTEHIKTRMAGKGVPDGSPDPTILNPARLEPKKAEAVCNQCHLQGESRILMTNKTWDSYDPRTPLEEHMGIYVLKDDKGPEFGIASHGHRLSMSRCATDEKLTCTTCHNPHQKSTAKTHRLSCLGCHQQEACGEQKGRSHGSDCVGCHMRKDGTSDIPHVNFTDHFIRKKPFEDQPSPKAETIELTDIFSEKRATDDSLKVMREALAHHDVWSNNKSPTSEEHAQKSRELLEKALEGHPNHPEGLHALGELFLRHGDPATAVTHLERANALLPDHSMLLLDLGNAYAGSNNLGRAIDVWTHATQVRDDFRDAWVNLANVYQSSNDIENALKAYEKADEIAPEFATSAYNRGMGSLKRGASRSARKWFDEAIRRDPTVIDAYLRLGMLELEMQRYPTVHELATRIMKIDKNYAAAYWLRGEALMGAAYFEDAVVDFSKLIELAPDMEVGYLKLAKAHRALGNDDAAKESVHQAITHFGRTPKLKDALRELSVPSEKMPWEH